MIDDEGYEHKVKHVYEGSDKEDYDKQFVIVGLNYSVYLKSNLSSDTLKSMSELGLSVMRDIKKIE